jgi:hypothetical protein
MVTENMAEAGEFYRTTVLAILVVGGERIFAATSAAAVVVVFRALESISEHDMFQSLFGLICLCTSRTITLTSKFLQRG